ncbi:MAG: hypothetical protein L0229_12095 [Blastocatellia bacterium]|nr:hypothetical protein [Blastocatellia bacterium]
MSKNIPQGVQESFDEIIKNIKNEAYDKCASSALSFLKEFKDDADAKDYLPYAKYFRFFSEGYRTWQISYHYTRIRNSFYLARRSIEDASTENTEPAEPVGEHHRILVEAFTYLSDMLCAYTRCENSFINNDPFSLRKYSSKALEIEKRALNTLSNFSSEDTILNPICEWLKEYFKKNQLLHEGLNACAEIYCDIFQQHHVSDEKFRRNMKRAKDSNKELAKLSEELSSELNAHIRHIDKHYDRLNNNEQNNTFLRVSRGRLVLALSATGNAGSVRRVIDDIEKFKDEIESEFGKNGVAIENFRPMKLHDIFETTFGSNYLKNISFDLPRIRLSLFDDKKYIFDTSINLSALGVCTVFFSLSLEKYRLSVEEIRVLQSCICPHAGEVKLDLSLAIPGQTVERGNKEGGKKWFSTISRTLTDFSNSLRRFLPGIANQSKNNSHDTTAFSKFKLMERLDISELLAELESINKWLKHPDSREMQTIQTRIKTLEEELLIHRDPDGQFNTSKVIEYVSEIIEGLKSISLRDNISNADKAALNGHINKLVSVCNTYRYLSDVAQMYLDIIKNVFEKIAGDVGREFPATDGEYSDFSQDKNWQLCPDTGWYTYLFASSIDKVKADNSVLFSQVDFDKLAAHPDMVGFIIEQREARASFDDWRFMNINILEEENLARIRSHYTDAFYGSEYQAFLYFPDDPMFLTEQYEFTVGLMMRLSIILKHYNTLTHRLTMMIRNDLEEIDRKTGQSSRQMRKLRTYLHMINKLRSEAGEMTSLEANASISRYKDHGDLMKKLVDKMKLNSIVESIDRHLSNLDVLTRNILTSLEEQREKRLNNFALFITLLFAATAISVIVEAAFKLDYVKGSKTDEGLQGLLTIAIWLISMIGILIYFLRVRN